MIIKDASISENVDVTLKECSRVNYFVGKNRAGKSLTLMALAKNGGANLSLYEDLPEFPQVMPHDVVGFYSPQSIVISSGTITEETFEARAQMPPKKVDPSLAKNRAEAMLGESRVSKDVKIIEGESYTTKHEKGFLIRDFGA